MLNDDYNDLEIEYPISPSSAEDVTAGELTVSVIHVQGESS
jgi:hypothetical protein